MADAADDLSTPLGQETVRAKRRFRLPFTATQALAVLLGLFLVTFVGFALFNDDPLGGEPRAKIVLRQPGPEAEKAAAAHPNAEIAAALANGLDSAVPMPGAMASIVRRDGDAQMPPLIWGETAQQERDHRPLETQRRDVADVSREAALASSH